MHTALGREYCIEEAGSTGEALQIMYRKAVAVFLCDADIPGYAEVLEQMHRDKELSLIPVFAVTDQEDEDGQIRALSLGTAGIITKTIKMRGLRVQIQNALEYRWISLSYGAYGVVFIYAEPAGSKRCGIELVFQWRGGQ